MNSFVVVAENDSADRVVGGGGGDLCSWHRAWHAHAMGGGDVVVVLY